MTTISHASSSSHIRNPRIRREEENTKKEPSYELNKDVLSIIFSFADLDFATLERYRLVSKQWKHVVDRSSFITNQKGLLQKTVDQMLSCLAGVRILRQEEELRLAQLQAGFNTPLTFAALSSLGLQTQRFLADAVRGNLPYMIRKAQANNAFSFFFTGTTDLARGYNILANPRQQISAFEQNKAIQSLLRKDSNRAFEWLLNPPPKNQNDLLVVEQLILSFIRRDIQRVLNHLSTLLSLPVIQEETVQSILSALVCQNPQKVLTHLAEIISLLVTHKFSTTIPLLSSCLLEKKEDNFFEHLGHFVFILAGNLLSPLRETFSTLLEKQPEKIIAYIKAIIPDLEKYRFYPAIRSLLLALIERGYPSEALQLIGQLQDKYEHYGPCFDLLLEKHESAPDDTYEDYSIGHEDMRPFYESLLENPQATTRGILDIAEKLVETDNPDCIVLAARLTILHGSNGGFPDFLEEALMDESGSGIGIGDYEDIAQTIEQMPNGPDKQQYLKELIYIMAWKGGVDNADGCFLLATRLVLNTSSIEDKDKLLLYLFKYIYHRYVTMEELDRKKEFNQVMQLLISRLNEVNNQEAFVKKVIKILKKTDFSKHPLSGHSFFHIKKYLIRFKRYKRQVPNE